MDNVRDVWSQGEASERRRHRRYDVLMHATAVRRQAEDPAGEPRVIDVFVRNISDGGLGGLCSEPLREDEELTLLLPQQGGRGGRDVRCRVTRCEAAEARFRVGLVFRDPQSVVSEHVQ